MADCIYIVFLPIGTTINTTIINMDIECEEFAATSDYLEFRDGKSSDSPLIERLCGIGKDNPTFLQTTQNYLRIR